ncbi:MAG: hypothetical protein N5P05_002842 [Chroococcopsis gigantea SAG 12.99]|jgi:hypothetical protein|nr:hypothetical protein [Chlorogloea purpurea SAG 13.99]MDV3001236.1 hypothetical protein [Chroococcopsis gigantea SAG 12.99]
MNDSLFEKKYLAENLWQDEENIYPWDHFSEEMDKYIEKQTGDFQDNEIDNQSEKLLKLLNSRWQSIDLQKLQQSLEQEYSQQVPSNWIKDIVGQVKEFFGQSSDSLEELLACVKPLFPQYNTDDLRVIGGPIAYPTRGGKEKDSGGNWEQLSEKQKIKVTMRIAQSALNRWKNAEIAQ